MIKTNVYLYSYQELKFEIKDFFSSYRLNKLDSNEDINIQIEYIIKISLEHYLSRPIKKLEFLTTKMGKPILKIDNVYLNISHSNNYLAVAISNEDIAVDIERISNKHLKVSKRLTDDYLDLSTEQATKMWTIKESYLKYYSMSILSNLKLIEFNNNLISGPNGSINYVTNKLLDYYLTIILKDISNITYYLIKDLNNIDEFNIINKSFEEEE